MPSVTLPMAAALRGFSAGQPVAPTPGQPGVVDESTSDELPPPPGPGPSVRASGAGGAPSASKQGAPT
eukprot:7014895-Alexandrium_andersonii.AAC.1